MKTVSLLWMLIFFSTLAKAQMPMLSADGSVTVKKPEASFTFTPYSRNVVKVVMQPNGYKTNEAISDAVMAKPINSVAKVNSARDADYVISLGNVQFVSKGDTFFFGNKRNAFLANGMENGDYKGFRFVMSDGEKIFGGGERALPQNRRGYKFNLYNGPAYGYGLGQENLNYSVPVLTSSNNYALFFDNPSKGYVDIGKTAGEILEYGACSNQLNFFLIVGKSYEEILLSYHALTGTQPLPPRYAMGNFQSRFGYTSEKDLMDIKTKMKETEVPMDAVIIDLFWFGDSIKGTLGNLSWVNKKAWPNPAKMIGGLRRDGIKTILITEPFIVDSTLNYTISKKYHAVDSSGKPFLIKNFYFGKAGLIDMFRKDSRDWFWTKYQEQMRIGVDNWWGDLGEPETHPSDVFHNLKDLGFKRMFKADEVHNLYGHYWTKMLFEKYAAFYPDKRLFSLNRSGFAGTQRYGIIPWTGDVGRNWSGLQAQMPVLLGMSMSGVPYVHSDAGGFAGGEKDEELYVRWLQFAQYTPIFRPHGTELTTKDPGAISFPSEPALHPQPYIGIVKKVVENRYSLLPHNYTLAYQQSVLGKPLISPLYYYFGSDSNSYKVEDEYMWGSDMLIAPVTQKGATSRRIYLPQGKWYNYATMLPKQGGYWFTDSADLEHIPVYAKEGSFIVTNNTSIQNTDKYNTSDITVTYFPSEKFSDYMLYDDDGFTNKTIEKNQFEIITFETTGWGKEGKIIIRSNGRSFIGKPVKRKIVLAIPDISKQPAAVMINGKASDGNIWDEELHVLKVPLTFTGDTLEVMVKE